MGIVVSRVHQAKLSMGVKSGPFSSRRETYNPDEGQCFGDVFPGLVPEGTIVSIVQVFPLVTLVLPRVVSDAQATQVVGETRLIGTWHTALLEETSHR